LSNQHASQASENDENILPGYLGETPLPGTLPPRGSRTWVDRPEQLIQAVHMLLQSPIVAIDAEFAQNRHPNQGGASTSSLRLALLQLAIDGQCFVVDALRVADLAPLATVTDDPAFMILLHGAGADLKVMAERGLHVAHYCDIEAASRSIFGQQESSLAAMMYRAFHTRMDKSLQRTDWMRRPLPPAMVAYAARDAEMTLALYGWLKQHYSWALPLHEYSGEALERVASWIEPFLLGTSPVPVEVAVAEAKARGGILSDAQIEADCRAALVVLNHPMHRNRLIRIITDLSLTQLAPEIERFLQSPAADERASALRALGKLNIESARALIVPCLQDPVFDVRKAAASALRNLGNKTPRPPALPPKIVEGARSWTVGGDSSDADEDWKARLRSMLDQQ
jgi:ribonuclease D